MNPIDTFVGALAVLGATSVLALLTADRRTLVGVINFVGTACAAAAMLWLAAKALTAGPIEFALGGVRVLGLSAQLAFRIDGLSALFLIIIAVLFTAAALYGIGYLAHYRRESLRRYYFPFPLFMAGMLAVVSTLRLVLVPGFLGVHDPGLLFPGDLRIPGKAEPLRRIHLLLHDPIDLGGADVGGDLLVQPDGIVRLCVFARSFPFARAVESVGLARAAGTVLHRLRHQSRNVSPGHLAAGSASGGSRQHQRSALRSHDQDRRLRIAAGFRVGAPVSGISSAWGTVIASLGVVSMLIGTLRALGENDSKRLLAQSSIGQMGYILLGLGLGMAFLPHSPLFGAVALVGCLYHVINHACFKSLLFFNSGSILYRTGTRDLNQLGGLVKVMPLAAACAMVGALAIAGAPPLNGFASKWLLYQSAILGETGTPLFVLYGVVAIFVGTLTLACFVKYLGSAYLGTLAEGVRRQEAEVRSQESGVRSQEAEETVTARFPSVLSLGRGERGRGVGVRGHFGLLHGFPVPLAALATALRFLNRCKR